MSDLYTGVPYEQIEHLRTFRAGHWHPGWLESRDLDRQLSEDRA